MHDIVYLTPLITAAIGWLTNWLAIKMLFRPRKPINLLLIKLHGLIPKRQSDLAKECAEIIERELLHQHMISDAVKSLDTKPVIEEAVTRLIEQKLLEKLKQIPMLGSFINASTIKVLKEIAIKEMVQEADWMKSKFAEDIEGKFHIKSIIQDKIEAFDLDKLEEIIFSVSKREFRMIEVIGAVLGFAIGVLQIILIHFT